MFDADIVSCIVGPGKRGHYERGLSPEESLESLEIL